ncbi:AMP-binding protein [Phaeobacter gallaeciensis]|uniref:AMP-binding protein n=1 Tax=Phaeobacter gallaeciensis TaxID=60890 RepID=UPI000BBC3825|nr:AMP-binding protein [Phaeobacter gallaeciensis]ATF18572.1 Non-ribosomal peptide synthetase module [Phaeobacter gallaeciensis]ATF22681.1 Non-ribosomal peptide synthetase module [Phaeobacter gallaeciensis]
MTRPAGDLADSTSAHARLREIFAAFEGDTRPAYCTPETELSFAALFDHARALAHQLQQQGDSLRNPVLIYGHKDIRYPVAYWACLLAGRALIPVEPETPVARIRQIAETCGARLLLGAGLLSGEITDALKGAQLACLPVPDPSSPCAQITPDPSEAPVITDQDLAYLMFSSGTLGQPKGIGITYANLVDFIDWLDVLYPSAVPMTAVSGVIRHCFDVSLFELWMSWTRRRPLVALDHAEFANSTAYLERLAEHEVSLWVSTPSITRLFLKNRRFNGDQLPHLRNFVFCGEVLTKKIAAALFDRFPGCRITNTYGPTECTVAVTSVDITDEHIQSERDLPIGAPRPGTRLERGIAQAGQPGGELLIRGVSVGAGYVGLPEKTRAAFPEPALYRTGDRGYLAPDGLWYFVGRIDREVKIQGVRVNLNDIETHLRNLPGVEDAVVEAQMLRGVPHALSAYVLGPRQLTGLTDLAARLTAELPPYLVPRYWYADFPAGLNQNSKFDRSKLANAAADARLRHIHMPSSVAQISQEEPA